jgi:hypothetical protein
VSGEDKIIGEVKQWVRHVFYGKSRLLSQELLRSDLTRY